MVQNARLKLAEKMRQLLTKLSPIPGTMFKLRLKMVLSKRVKKRTNLSRPKKQVGMHIVYISYRSVPNSPL